MSSFGVHPRIAGPTSMSRRGPVFALAVALVVAAALLIAGVTTASHGTSAASVTSLPQQRDMAPIGQFRDPETHALLWIPADSATQLAADSAPQQPLRPRYPGK